MSNKYQHWLLEIKGNIGYLTFNRPDKKNRIDETTLAELGAISAVIRKDADIWVVVLQANGDCFPAGVDIKTKALKFNV